MAKALTRHCYRTLPTSGPTGRSDSKPHHSMVNRGMGLLSLNISIFYLTYIYNTKRNGDTQNQCCFYALALCNAFRGCAHLAIWRPKIRTWASNDALKRPVEHTRNAVTALFVRVAKRGRDMSWYAEPNAIATQLATRSFSVDHIPL
jgi:hypothetical protein